MTPPPSPTPPLTPRTARTAPGGAHSAGAHALPLGRHGRGGALGGNRGRAAHGHPPGASVPGAAPGGRGVARHPHAGPGHTHGRRRGAGSSHPALASHAGTLQHGGANAQGPRPGRARGAELAPRPARAGAKGQFEWVPLKTQGFYYFLGMTSHCFRPLMLKNLGFLVHLVSLLNNPNPELLKL